jgi:serine beta-lactamase-like protein LACTB, mitochondrial
MPNARVARILRASAPLLAITFLLLTFCSAQEHLAAQKRSQIEAAVSKFMSTTHVPGLSIAVIKNGELEWATGFGFADLENHVSATDDTLFRLASISKSLTATGAIELWQQGKLDLDAPVQKYCPAFPQKSAPITTRLVMGHLAGIRHYRSDSQDDPEVGNTKHFDNPIQGGLDFFKNDPLLSEPGKQFHYSTHSYTLVGCVMEGASGTKYIDFMRQNVFLPAGMDHTQVDDRFAIIPYRTRFYQKTKSGPVENADFLDSSYKIPGGGWLSSAEDMAHFEIAIMKDKLLKPATRELMWTALKPSAGQPNGYALGWGTFTENGVRYVGHDGGQQGTSTSFLIAPKRGAGVVVLANMEGLPVNELSKEMLKILVGSSSAQQK